MQRPSVAKKEKVKLKRFTCKKCKSVIWSDPEKIRIAEAWLDCEAKECALIDHLEPGNTYGGLLKWTTQVSFKQPVSEKVIAEEPGAIKWLPALSSWA